MTDKELNEMRKKLVTAMMNTLAVEVDAGRAFGSTSLVATAMGRAQVELKRAVEFIDELKRVRNG